MCRPSAFRCLPAVLALAVVPACADHPVAPNQLVSPDRAAVAAFTDHSGPVSLRDRYIVRLNDEVTSAASVAMAASELEGVRVHYVYEHAIKGFAATLPQEALAAIRSNPVVARVNSDVAAWTFTVPSWGLDRVDQRNLPLDDAYQPAGDAGAGVHVYVLDGGIYSGHSQFDNRVVTGPDSALDALRPDTSSYYAEDCWGQDPFPFNFSAGHGTHVAGIIAGSSYGIARYASLISVRVFECNDTSSVSAVLAGVDWIAGNYHTPAVVNFSGGFPASRDSIDILEDAIQASVAEGVTYIVAAGQPDTGPGNDACDYAPGDMSETVTVGASTDADARWTPSNYGTCVDLFAPGEDIVSAYFGSGGTPSPDSSRVLSGTSQAAPHVTGIAAIYLGDHPTASPASVRSYLLQTATSGSLSNIGSGSPNLLAFTPHVLDDSIAGPVDIIQAGNYTWHAVASGGTYSYDYEWSHRFRYAWGPGSWSAVGTDSTLTLTVGSYDPDFELRLIVDSGEQDVTDYLYVAGPCDDLGTCPEKVPIRRAAGESRRAR